SLFVALVVNPALASRFMKVGEHHPNIRKAWKQTGTVSVIGTLIAVLGSASHSSGVFGFGMLVLFIGVMIIFFAKVVTPATSVFQNNLLPRLEARYERFLRYALSKHHPRTFFIGTFGLLFLAFILLG